MTTDYLTSSLKFLHDPNFYCASQEENNIIDTKKSENDKDEVEAMKKSLKVMNTISFDNVASFD